MNVPNLHLTNPRFLQCFEKNVVDDLSWICRAARLHPARSRANHEGWAAVCAFRVALVEDTVVRNAAELVAVVEVARRAAGVAES